MRKLWMLGLLASGWSAIAFAADLAKVNGRNVTTTDVKMALTSTGLNDGQQSNLLSNEVSRRQVLDSLIERELLAQEAERAKLDKSAEFNAAMASFRKQYLANKVAERVVQGKVSNDAVKKYYNANKRIFTTDKVYVQHILLKDAKTAREILKAAKAPKADFGELAEKHSIDPSAKTNRGQIGPVSHDSPFVKEFKTAAFAAKKGEVIGPVETTFGHHVIKVVDKEAGRTLNFEEVEVAVKALLQQELVKSYVGKLKAKSKIIVNEKALDKL